MLKLYRVPDMYDFKEAIDKYEKIHEKINISIPTSVRLGWLTVKVLTAKD